jgi:SAM-dependent methyltransferase
MTTTGQSDTYLDPYRRALRTFGAGFEATLWSSREGQRVRFDIMLDMARFEGAIVLDIGCGSGDFAAYLIERRIAFRQYIGIDGLPGQIEAAERRTLSNCEFITGDVVADPALLDGIQPPPDLICISGTLNTMREEVAKTMLERAWHTAQRGLVFNFLSDRAPSPLISTDLRPAVRFNTVGMIDWAMTLSPRVQFRQDYLDGHDATIAIERAEEPEPDAG